MRPAATKHIVTIKTTQIEHEAFLNACQALEVAALIGARAKRGTLQDRGHLPCG